MEYQRIFCYIGLSICMTIIGIVLGLLILKPKKTMEFLSLYSKKVFVLVIIVGLVGRYLSVLSYFGVVRFVHDFDVFMMWANMINDDGLRGFVSEYPALYLYIIGSIEWVLRLLGFNDQYIITTLVLKSPAIIAEVVLGIFIYKIARKRTNEATALLLGMLIIFSPAHVINSAMWGQVDGLYLVFLVVSLYYLDNDRRFISAIFYLIAFMIKIQTIFFAPIFGMMFIMPLIKADKVLDKKIIINEYILPSITCLVLFFVLTIPIKTNISELWILDFFKHITIEHPSNTNSALNLFGLHGGNAVDYNNSFLFLNYKIWGYVFIVLTCLTSAILSLKNKKHSLYILSAFCIASIYTLGVSMHERYILPVIALLVISCVFNYSKKKIILIGLYTVLATINQCMILFDLFGGRTSSFKFMSAISVGIYLYFVYVCINEINFSKEIGELEDIEKNRDRAA